MTIYFAWTDDPDVPFKPSEHARYDLPILSLEISQTEGEYATMTIVTRNEGVGLLRTGTPKWCLLSESRTGDPADAELLFRGRVSGIPTDLAGITYALEFTAQPDRAAEKMAAYAETLKVAPWWDPLYGESDDPADVLAARSALYDIDPRTHRIRLTDFLTGELTLDLGNKYDHESFEIGPGEEPPLTSVSLKVAGEWEQQATGDVNLKDRVTPLGEIRTVTPDAMESLLPTAGSGIGDSSGWTCSESLIERVGDYGKTLATFHTGEKWYWMIEWQDEATGTGGILRDGYCDRLGTLWTSTWEIKAFRASYDYRQPRREEVTITLGADLQPVLGEESRSETLPDLTLEGLTEDRVTPLWTPKKAYKRGDRVQHNGRFWECILQHTSDTFFSVTPTDGREVIIWGNNSIGIVEQWKSVTSEHLPLSKRGDHFFDTARGAKAIDHAILRARAFLRARMRYVMCKVTGRWRDLRDVTCRHSVRITHPRLPGKELTGKVVSYTKAWAEGSQSPTVTIELGVSVGTEKITRKPRRMYSDALAPGYVQGKDGKTEHEVEGITWAISGETPKRPVIVNRLSLPSYACIGADWDNLYNEQLQHAAEMSMPRVNVAAKMGRYQTKLKLRMRSLAAQDTLVCRYTVECEDLTGPRGINLGA